MEKLIIKRSEWLRGEGYDRSALLRPFDNKKCCLGFYALSCGLKEKDIIGIDSPSRLRNYLSDRPKDDLQPDWLFVSKNHYYESKDCCTLMNINDSKSCSDEKREKIISETFAKHGVEVEFIG